MDGLRSTPVADPQVEPVAVDGALFRVEVGSRERPEVIRWSTPVGRQVYDAYAVMGGGAEGSGGAGAVLIDPYLESEAVWDELLGMLGRRPVATVLTSSWHERSAYRLREREGVPVWMPAAGVEEMTGRPDRLFTEGDELPGGLGAITVNDGFAGDTVLVWRAERAKSGERVLFSGDAILGQLNPEDTRSDHWRWGPGVYLWLHGPGDRERFRSAFGRVLEEEFGLVCTAHSVVLRTSPRERLAELLETGDVVERPMSYGSAVAMVAPAVR